MAENAILDFWLVDLLTAHRVWSDKDTSMYQISSKLSNGCRDVAIFTAGRSASAIYYAMFKCCFHKGKDATSIPSQCCAYPYTLNGGLYYNCTVNPAVSTDLGCYNTYGQWVQCQQPAGMFFTVILNFHPTAAICPSNRLSHQVGSA